ncbi:hypothetical protein SUNDANCE_94 [Brevibacillus phage Sundance]|uniref:hypothetical protein n=1 Tax=Brevibacillus phage Sundance TaxID=1691958 RepID=UPI0006BD3751|nr:hypothetical protein AVT09_gp094 [Brevibacillus phage Sundance]ALA47910.1 hypothetical protein SUNDANCE_94 [Brevibacillus phage Sundance]
MFKLEIKVDIVDRKLRVSFKGFNDKRQMELIANALSESYFLGYTDGAEDSVKLAKKIKQGADFDSAMEEIFLKRGIE